MQKELIAIREQLLRVVASIDLIVSNPMEADKEIKLSAQEIEKLTTIFRNKLNKKHKNGKKHL